MPQRSRGLRRLLALFGEPVYRTKLLVFGLLGGVITLAGALAPSGTPRDILYGLSVTIWGVAIVQVLWDFVGGDPMSAKLDSISDAAASDRDILARSMTLLADLLDGSIGIERVWPTRREWSGDPRSGTSAWHDLVCRGRSIKIASSTLWSGWLNNPDFRRRFLHHVATGNAHACILLYDPREPVLERRAADEGERLLGGSLQMRAEIAYSLNELARGTRDWDAATKARLQVRLTYLYPHPAQIVLVDQRMLVALYLSGHSGGSAPTFQLTGPSAFFKTYSDQFDILWGRAWAIEDLDEYMKMLESWSPSADRL